MTTEEIIHIYENSRLMSEHFTEEALTAVFVAGLAALHAQQSPAKLDRSCWEGCEMCRTKWSKEDWGEGGAHDFRINGDTLYYFDAQFGWEGIKIKYCPFCGRPLTEAAWAELERRNGGNDGKADKKR